MREDTNGGGGAALKARSRMSAGAVLVAVLVAPALLVYAWSRPVAAPPREMPPLVLDPSAVHDTLARDAELAAQAPSGERAEARARLYREANTAERAADDPPGRGEARRAELERALAALLEEGGEAAVAAARSSDLAELEPALRGELSDDERDAAIGGFVAMMQRYELVRDGARVAPRFVIRTLFAARWNAMHGRELTEGFSPVEGEAYWGWLGLRAEGAPIERRLEAIARYAEAGGAHADEARAVLLFDAGRLDEAREAFERAHAHRPSFRLQNHVLACALDEGSTDDPAP